MLKKAPVVFFVAFFVFGHHAGDAMGMGQDYKAQIREKFKKVDFSDGVDEEEAIIIVQNGVIASGDEKNFVISSAKIFSKNDPHWSKDSWPVFLRTTFRERMRSGLEWTVVNVNKKTGEETPGGAGPDL